MRVKGKKVKVRRVKKVPDYMKTGVLYVFDPPVQYGITTIYSVVEFDRCLSERVMAKLRKWIRKVAP